MPSKSASDSFQTMKRIETSPEEAEVNEDLLSALFKYELIKFEKNNKKFYDAFIGKFFKKERRIKYNFKNERLFFGQHPLVEKSPHATDIPIHVYI